MNTMLTMLLLVMVNPQELSPSVRRLFEELRLDRVPIEIGAVRPEPVRYTSSRVTVDSRTSGRAKEVLGRGLSDYTVESAIYDTFGLTDDPRGRMMVRVSVSRYPSVDHARLRTLEQMTIPFQRTKWPKPAFPLLKGPEAAKWGEETMIHRSAKGHTLVSRVGLYTVASSLTERRVVGKKSGDPYTPEELAEWEAYLLKIISKLQSHQAVKR